MRQMWSIVRKELDSYFGSPMALIFVGVFLGATLFTFFWVDAFFARGVADLRPMFRRMPVLLIFLVAALTMRQWSEEQRSGTLEVLLTLPARTAYLALGKFVAALILVTVALALTLFLPISVALMGELDWGPVLGGYLAAILLAAAYIAIGLFVSSRTDNQIVALILTILIGGFFYLIGSPSITGFTSDNVAAVLRAIGSGSRFESIERGVIDLRDLAYYLSLTVLFLTLNVVSLISKGWSHSVRTQPYRRAVTMVTWLIVLNLVFFNLWLAPLTMARADLTARQEYSLSSATREILQNLQEPLLIRAYFSELTHPLLAPLVPRITDMLEEYRIASNGRVQIEIVDPLQDPEREVEANQTYGINPTPLQAADRYGASVVNAYFDLLVRYGDQFETLNFVDLIEIQPYPGGDLDVRLRNLEYDLTRAIKKTVYGFQSIDNVLASLPEPARLTLYVTPNTLPQWARGVPETITKVAKDIESKSIGKFSFEMVNPDDPNSPVTRQTLAQQYGMTPIPVGLFSDTTYYLHMILQAGGKQQLLFPSGDFSEASVRTSIESAIKRAAPGFLKVVGIWTPPNIPTQNMFGQTQPSFKRYTEVAAQLRRDYTVRPMNLSDGKVPPDTDVLLVIAPQMMDDKQRYAVDQFLMRGGSVVVAAGNYVLNPDQFTGQLGVQAVTGGMKEMLAHYGIQVKDEMVLDLQNEPFPVQTTRSVGGFQVREIQAINYPFFVDVRQDGMDRGSPILANLPAVTLNWASPVETDAEANKDRQVTVLLRSSPDSWTTTDINVTPDLERYPQIGFPLGSERKSYPLAVSVQGSFESFFKGKPSPLSEQPASDGEAPAEKPEETVGTIERSPANTRLIVVGSAEFLNDIVFDLSAHVSGDRYLNSLKFVQNAVDWSVEDEELLTIRARGSSANILKPMTQQQQSLWEGANYVVALLGLVAIGVIWRERRRNEQPIALLPREEIGPARP